MQLLNVYVEGARDPSVEGRRRVAAQIAARYDLPIADLEKRLAQGRFRVKANVDEATANAFVADLESLGARCSVVAAGRYMTATPPPAPDSTLTGLPALSDEPGPRVPPAPPPVLARPGALPDAGDAGPLLSRTATLPLAGLATRRPPTVQPPVAAARPTHPSLLAEAEAAIAPPGLAAALAGHALESASFSLTTLDERGAEPGARPEERSVAGAPMPVEEKWPGTVTLLGMQGPARAATPPPLPAVPAATPARPSAFAPPEELHLLTLEAPPAVRGHLAPMHLAPSAPAVAAPYAAVTRASGPSPWRGRLAFAAGILLSVGLGFAPAHLLAASKEAAAYQKIDNRLRAAQSDITTVEEWKQLDDIRTARMRDKKGAQQEIAVLAMLIWVGISAAASLAWLRWGLPLVAPLPTDD